MKQFFLHWLQRRLRKPVKRIIYKRLYGGHIGFWESCIIKLYRHLPDQHPVVRATIEGR